MNHETVVGIAIALTQTKARDLQVSATPDVLANTTSFAKS